MTILVATGIVVNYTMYNTLYMYIYIIYSHTQVSLGLGYSEPGAFRNLTRTLLIIKEVFFADTSNNIKRNLIQVRSEKSGG